MKQLERDYIAGVKAGTWTTWSEEGLVANVQDTKDTPGGPQLRQPVIVLTEDGDAEHNVSHLLGPCPDDLDAQEIGCPGRTM